MKKLLFSLALLFSIIQIQAQPIPQDTSDIVWHIPTGGNIYQINFSSDTKQIAVAFNQHINFYDVNDGRFLKSIEDPSSFWNCEYSNDGKYVASTLRSGWIKVWKIEDTSLVFKYETKQEFMFSLNFSQDDKYLAVAGENLGILIFETTTWSKVKEIKNFPFKWDPKTGGSPKGYYVKYNQDGTKLLFSGDWAFIYDLTLDTIVHQFPINQTPQYSPDFSKIAIMQRDPAEVFIYDSETYQQVGRITLGGKDNFNFTFSPDGNHIVTASEGETVAIWGNETGEKKYLYKHWLAPHNHVASSNDEKFLAASTVSGDLFLLNARYITGIKSDNDKIVNTIYPNPTSGIVRIEFNLRKSEKVNFSISDNIARIVKSIDLGILDEGNNSFEFNASTLSVGKYFIKLQSNTFLQTFKLVKE